MDNRENNFGLGEELPGFLDAKKPTIASELIGKDEKIKSLFLTLTYFMDDQEAMDYADIIHKCEKHGMVDQKKRWLYRVAAKCSIKGYRSAQIVDVLTQIQRMEEEAIKKREKKIDSQSTNA